MHEAKGVTELVQNDASFLGSNGGRVAPDPAQVHRGIVGIDKDNFIPNVRPRSQVGIKGDTNGSIASGDEGKVDVGIPFPLLDNFFDFVLLNGVPGLWAQEGVSQGLSKAVIIIEEPTGLEQN